MKTFVKCIFLYQDKWQWRHDVGTLWALLTGCVGNPVVSQHNTAHPRALRPPVIQPHVWNTHQLDLTHCGLETPNGDITLTQVMACCQAMAWINIDLSLMGICDTQARPVSRDVLKILIRKMSLKNTLVNHTCTSTAFKGLEVEIIMMTCSLFDIRSQIILNQPRRMLVIISKKW